MKLTFYQPQYMSGNYLLHPKKVAIFKGTGAGEEGKAGDLGDEEGGRNHAGFQAANI